MSLPDRVQGALRPSILISWYKGATPEDLTDATITGTIFNKYTCEVRAIAGTLTLIDADGGQFRWDLDAADVAEAGNFEVQFTAQYPSPPTPGKSFGENWTVIEAHDMGG